MNKSGLYKQSGPRKRLLQQILAGIPRRFCVKIESPPYSTSGLWTLAEEDSRATALEFGSKETYTIKRNNSLKQIISSILFMQHWVIKAK